MGGMENEFSKVPQKYSMSMKATV